MQTEIGSQRIPMDPRLYRAAREGDIYLLESLLTSEGVVNGVDHAGPGGQLNCLLGVTHSGDTALHIASYFGHSEMAWRICSGDRSLLLMENNKSETPLHYAAQAGKNELVAYFIHVARVEPRIGSIFQPEGVDVLKELVRKKNRDGETALYQAVHNKHCSVVEILISADPHLATISDNNNTSPLYLAAMQDLPDIVDSLTESLHGIVPPEAYAGPDGQTALHAAAFGQIGVVRSILNRKPDLAKAKDDTGSTPLHYAASANNVEAIELLLENNKAPAYISDSCGLFPLHVAVKLGNLKVVTKLFELCPDSDELLDAKGRSFLHIAVKNTNFFVVSWARKNGKLDRALNVKDDEGNTPMHLAIKARDLFIFIFLLENKKLDLGIANKKGLTPLDLAIAQNTKPLHNSQSREYIIYRTLMVIRSRQGIRRGDHFINEYKVGRNQEQIEKESENFENMAKSSSTVSVLIASASFAGFFTVSGAYKADLIAQNQSFELNLAFKAFIITVTFAFISSITATGLFMYAAMTYIDPIDRFQNLHSSLRLVKTATKCLVTAFALGAYVILAPGSKWLAVLICLTGFVTPILLNPLRRANIIISSALLRSMGWKELRKIQRKLSRRVPGRFKYILFYEWIRFSFNTLFYGFIVLLVLLCSILDISQGFPQVIVLGIVMVYLSLTIIVYWM